MHPQSSSVSDTGGMVRYLRRENFIHTRDAEQAWALFRASAQLLAAQRGWSVSGGDSFALLLGTPWPDGEGLFLHGTSAYSAPGLVSSGFLYPNVAFRRGRDKGSLGSSGTSGQPIPSAWAVTDVELARHWSTLVDSGNFLALMLDLPPDAWMETGWWIEAVAVVHRPGARRFESRVISLQPLPVVGFIMRLILPSEALWRTVYPRIIGGFSPPVSSERATSSSGTSSGTPSATGDAQQRGPSQGHPSK